MIFLLIGFFLLRIFFLRFFSASSLSIWYISDMIFILLIVAFFNHFLGLFFSFNFVPQHFISFFFPDLVLIFLIAFCYPFLNLFFFLIFSLIILFHFLSNFDSPSINCFFYPLFYFIFQLCPSLFFFH
jgi:hypothetical protein